MPTFSERYELKTALTELLRSINELAGGVMHRDRALPALVDGAEGFTARTAASDAYRSVEYRDEKDGRAVQRWRGVVVASAETLASAQRCNDAKDAFRKVCVKMRRERGGVEDEISDLLAHSREMRSLLSDVGNARLHLLQAYRRIPMAQGTVEQVGFVRASGCRVIERIPRDMAEKLLRRKGMSTQLIADIPEGGLYRGRGIPEHWRVNVTILIEEEKRLKRKRESMQAPLPVLVPAYRGAMPRVTGLDLERRYRNRARRIDARVAPEPIAEGLPLYRARPQ